MKIAIKRINNSNYIDKYICSRTQEVEADGIKKVVPLFDEETLKQPPYNYSFVEIDDRFEKVSNTDFDYNNGMFTFNEQKYNERVLKENNAEEIAKLKAELSTYDYIGTKIAMGVATKEDYAEQIAYTETLRDKIRQLGG